ncbi:ABC transporter substrate-binding protein [Paenarthrobacter sp. NPDC089989]|uniref:ABC transporter substrate-binding protein n=1 Tax=unclassified Paenarthrobacter TaxID=2634190 RepID=UPI0038164244
MKRLGRISAALLVAALALTGCQAGSGNTDQAAWPDQGTPGGGGTLTVVSNAELSSLEPGEAGTAGHAFPVLRNVLQGLLTRNTQTNEIEPLLATEWSSPDNLHWVFKLRKDVVWHDDTPLNAANAAKSLTYIWDKKVPYAGNFVGAPVKFSAIDEYTLGMELTAPDSLIPAKMTVMPLASPVQIETAPQTLPEKMIGTGPYKFVSFTPGSGVKLELNTKYFNLHPGMFDKVDWTFRTESQVRAQLVQTGEADVAVGVTPEQCEGAATSGAHCLSVQATGFRFLRPDQYNQTVLADERIRQAIAMGVDRPGIVSAFINKDGKVLDNAGPEGMVGFDKDVKSFNYDVDAAKKLVADAKADGINTGLPLTIKYRVGFFPNIDDMAQTVATNLNAIGLNAKVEAMTDAEGLAQYRQNFEGNTIEKIPADRGWIFLATTTNDLFDFSQPADTLLTCKGKFSVTCDQEFEAAYKKANQLVGDERQKAFADLWSSLYEKDVPFLPIGQTANNFVISDRAKIQPTSDTFLPLTEARGPKTAGN